MFRFTSKITNADPWRIDGDGFLRVTMAVLRSGVFEYSRDDLPEELTKMKPGLKIWRVRIPESYSDEFLKSSEGKPVIAWDHDWQETQKIEKKQIMGAMAGSAKVEAGVIIIDAVINDTNTIAAIKSKDLQEISAGYHSDIEPLDGDADADAVQKPLSMNHVVLLPEGRGRCGPSVRILNARETTMVKVRIKNAAGEEKEYSFTSENDASEAAKMAKEQAAPAEEKPAAVAEEKPAEEKPAGEKPAGETPVEGEVKNHDLATAQAEFAKIADAMKGLEAEKILLEQRIKQFESEEYQEAQMQSRQEYTEGEKSLTENCDDGVKKEISDGLKNAKTMNERKRVVTSAICNAKGIQYDDKSVDVLFGVLVKTLNKASVTEVRKPVSAKIKNQGDETVHPIFARKG